MHLSDVKASNKSLKGIYYGSLSEDIQLPMLSLAPELTLRGVKPIFNEKTDVWTFGITLIELYQLGKLPYPGFQSVDDVLEFVSTGHIHPQPKFCPDAVYDRVVKVCLSQKRDRPMISAVLRELQQLMGVSPSYDTMIDFPRTANPVVASNSRLITDKDLAHGNDDLSFNEDDALSHEYSSAFVPVQSSSNEYSSTFVPVQRHSHELSSTVTPARDVSKSLGNQISSTGDFSSTAHYEMFGNDDTSFSEDDTDWDC